MNRPFFLVRIFGAPLVALPVVLFCCAVLVSCYQDHTSWLAGIFALGIGYRTSWAYNRMKQYKAWQRQWSAMNPDGNTGQPKQSRSLGSVITTLAMLLAVGYPVYVGSLPPHHLPVASEQVFALLWCIASVYLVAKLIWLAIRRTSRRRRLAGINAPVAWMIGKASSSPTRQAATKALPEYAARLLSGSIDRKRLEARESASVAAG